MSTPTIRDALDAAEQHANAQIWADHPLAIILVALIKQTRAALAAEPVGEQPVSPEVGEGASDEAAEYSRWLAFEAENALAAGRYFPASMLTGASELLAHWARPAAPAAPPLPEVESTDDVWWHELINEIARVQHVALGEGQGPRFDLAEAVRRWCRPASATPEVGEGEA